MRAKRLNNYLRTYRKHSGLSQSEVSFLVRLKGKSELSRHERSIRPPSLRTALACQELYHLPAAARDAELQACSIDMNSTTPIRVLALDLHPRSFGYVVVEGPNRLLDWGVRSRRRKSHSPDVLARRRLRPLLDIWMPSVLLLHHPARKLRPNPGEGRVLKWIMAEAKSRQIPVRLLKRKPGRDPRTRATKYENARRVAEHFPILGRNLPPKRRALESEDYRMSMFAAAAMTMA